MEQIITLLTSNPIYMVIAGVLLLLLLFGLLKKVLKIILVAVLCWVLYIGFLYYTGQDIPKSPNELGTSLKNTAGELLEKGREVMNKQNQKLEGPDPVAIEE